MDKQNKDLVIFMIITFLLPLVAIVLQSIFTNNLLIFVFYGIEAASPTIAAIIIISKNGKIKNFFMHKFHFKNLARAIILPLIFAFSTMFLAKFIFCFIFQIEFAFGSITSVQFMIISWAFIAEEFGWRGYLEPFLQMRGIHKYVVPAIVGMIWCLWHYHFFMLNGLQIPIMLFVSSCIIESYIYSYFMEYTKNNLISAMTYHFAWNLCIHLFAINPVDNNGTIFPYMILIVLEGLVLTIYFLIRKRNKNIPLQTQ